jgi:hypothetical protein
MIRLIRKLSEQLLKDESFSVEADVYLSIEGEDEIEYNNKALVRFKIDIDYRRWGMKDIMLSYENPVEIEYKAEKDTAYTTLKLDLDQLKLDGLLDENWAAGNSYTVEGIDVYLNEDRSIKSVYVNLVYAKPIGA